MYSRWRGKCISGRILQQSSATMDFCIECGERGVPHYACFFSEPKNNASAKRPRRRMVCVLSGSPGQLCAYPKHLIICNLFPSDAPNGTFKEYSSDSHQTMKHRICDFLGLRKCASSQHINMCSALRKILFITCVLTVTQSPFSTLLHTCGLQKVPVANAFFVTGIWFSLEVVDDDYLQTFSDHTNKTQLLVFYVIVLIMHGGG